MSNLTFEGSSGTHRVAGYRFAHPSPDTTQYDPVPDVKPPAKVDLRPFMTPVENQGELSSCTANAIAGAYEYLIKKHLRKNVDVSRLFIYYNARWRIDEQNEDSGSVIQYGVESLGTFGACVEKTWPYQERAVLRKPSKPSYAEAARFKVLDMQQVKVKLDAWRHCLADGYPIVFGCVLFDSFDDCNKRGGVVPMPNPRDVGRGEHGRHAMLCVGYSDVDQVFIVRNSWGDDWGVKGYCYMPYNYLMSKKLNDGDCWMLRSATRLPDPEETWIDDDKPVVRKAGAVKINEYPATAYDRVEIPFSADEAPLEYTADLPQAYVAFAENIEPATAFLEDDEDFVSADDEVDDEEVDVSTEEETEEEAEGAEEDDEAGDEEDDEAGDEEDDEAGDEEDDESGDEEDDEAGDEEDDEAGDEDEEEEEG
jgi:hypothetical protein